MINLIPKNAKKKLLTLYWSRVLTVWFVAWSSVLFLGILLLLPAYVSISGQVNAYKLTAETAQESNRDFESVVQALVRSSEQAAIIASESKTSPMSDYIGLIEELGGAEIQITNIGLKRSGYDIESGSVQGIARDRRSLSSFEDRLEGDGRIKNATLPHSAYAEDRDIKFNITLEFTPTKEIVI